MQLDHECRWTRRYESELTDRDSALHGAGVPSAVLKRAAALLGRELTTRPSKTDEYGAEITLADLAGGATHDECFFSLEPVLPELKRALLEAVLALHAHYLGSAVDWSRAIPEILKQWLPDHTIRLRSVPAKHRVRIRCYPSGAGTIARRLSKPLEIECSTGVATLNP